MKQDPGLCIVIPTFNRKEQLSVLLNQLKIQKVNDIEYKIVVVVDGSTDGTLELLRTEFPEVIVITGDGNWWFTRSLNEGCKYAVNVLKSKLILTCNDDVQLPDDYLRNILHNYSECGINSIIGSSSYSMTKPSMITFAGIKYKNPWTLKYHKYILPYTYKEPGELKGTVPSVTLPTRGLLIPSKVVTDLNYFEEKLLPQYSSDYDFVLRAAKKGAKIYLSYDAYVFEDMKLTSKGNARLSPGLKDYIKNVFFNKYSSNYFFKDLLMAWRFGIKPLFPLYFILIGMSVPYMFIKYKYILNSDLQKAN